MSDIKYRKCCLAYPWAEVVRSNEIILTEQGDHVILSLSDFDKLMGKEKHQCQCMTSCVENAEKK